MTAVIDFTSYEESVPALLHLIQTETSLPQTGTIVIKPNLINDSPPPITTPAACCRALVDSIRSISTARVVIAEGCGQPGLDTPAVFDRLGYTDMAAGCGVQLVDLNTAQLVRMHNPECRIFPEIFLPQIAVNSYLISVPVLKAHSLAGITGALKNMIGLAPPAYYSGQSGTWKKAAFHCDVQQSIRELNSYKAPDLCIMDASVGMPEYHLGGAHCTPPLEVLVGGCDPWEVDRKGAELLGRDWTKIKHLQK
ncbi:DUF362 domain-containing protein [Desulfovermiculus halophilus]|uniref:DUF362 domain-containing protein n=1 Tax=Desulfovermiculus halophilus TaxID=339722 RepID=UPI000486CF9C|nr:DUF362 domain-containing protein [Desulfovermiculus halophilus]